MAKSGQTFRKRQRENKLREKAQLKRERREQRQKEKKVSQALVSEPAADQANTTGVEPIAGDKDRSLEEGIKVGEL